MAKDDKQMQQLITKIATQVIRELAPKICEKIAEDIVSRRITFRGQLDFANPKSSLEAATKSSAGSGTFLPLGGGTMTGDLKALAGLKHNGNLGFFNTAETTKQTVTGSRGANAALASLLTALANYGLIVDSSS